MKSFRKRVIWNYKDPMWIQMYDTNNNEKKLFLSINFLQIFCERKNRKIFFAENSNEQRFWVFFNEKSELFNLWDLSKRYISLKGILGKNFADSQNEDLIHWDFFRKIFFYKKNPWSCEQKFCSFFYKIFFDWLIKSWKILFEIFLPLSSSKFQECIIWIFLNNKILSQWMRKNISKKNSL